MALRRRIDKKLSLLAFILLQTGIEITPVFTCSRPEFMLKFWTFQAAKMTATQLHTF